MLNIHPVAGVPRNVGYIFCVFFTFEDQSDVKVICVSNPYLEFNNGGRKPVTMVITTKYCVIAVLYIY